MSPNEWAFLIGMTRFTLTFAGVVAGIYALTAMTTQQDQAYLRCFVSQAERVGMAIPNLRPRNQRGWRRLWRWAR